MRRGKSRAIGILVALVAMLAVVPFAIAADIQGKVQSVDTRTGAITLDDGTTLKVMDAAQLKDIKPGASVKASYQEQGGEKVATSIQVLRGGGGASPAAPPKQ